MPDIHDLEVLLRSPVPLIVIESREERRVTELFKRVRVLHPKPLYRWTITEGLRRLDKEFGAQTHTRKPDELLGQIRSTRQPGIYLLSDFHPYVDDPMHVRLIKDIALAYDEVGHTLVFISHAFEIPAEIQWLTARFDLAVPTRKQLGEIVFAEARGWSKKNAGREVKTSQSMLDRLVDNLVGLPVTDAKRLARGAIEDDGAITESDLPEVMKTKFRLIGQDGVLAYEFDTAQFADVGGLERLKSWLEVRKSIFQGRSGDDRLDMPKGILLLGVQGCGKSLAAKAVAGAWGTPLLRLDFGTLYNKYHGETERNLRESLRQAEAMAPCVLWIDEIEKGVSVDSSDSGVSRRLLGSLLTWMAENRNRVFIVATANDIESLPPELLRKGRLDEIFFVDLPDEDTRRKILEIHLLKRKMKADGIDVASCAAACEGFSGAEIEQAIVSALYSAHARKTALTRKMVIDEISRTRPLSVVMSERIARLRAWAQERTVPAN
ncbi:MAG: AAA family ATPase [Gammaproteobacteria bacterium]|nr:AAA family ATPase [Gammaproteobacteria bacterium]